MFHARPQPSHPPLEAGVSPSLSRRDRMLRPRGSSPAADEKGRRRARDRERQNLDAQRKEVRLAILADLSRAFRSELDAQAVSRAIAHAVQAGVFVVLAGTNGRPPTCACAHGDADAENRVRANLEQSRAEVQATLEAMPPSWEAPVLVHPDGSDWAPPIALSVVQRAGLRELVAAPLRLEGRAAGVLGLWDGPGEGLGPEDFAWIAELSDLTAMAFERARMVERQRRAAEKLRLLADSGSVLAQSLEVESTLSTLARLAVQWFAEICVVNAVDEETVLGDVVAATDPGIEAAAMRVLDGYGKFGLVRFGTKQPEIWRSPAWLAPTSRGSARCSSPR